MVLDIESRRNDFVTAINSLSGFEDYAEDFIDYWTEPNKSNSKMRFELEKTWSLKSRLSRWKKNHVTNFGKNDSPVEDAWLDELRNLG